MTEEKLVELVQKIQEKTDTGILRWQTTADENEFQTTLSSFVIRIRRFSSIGEVEFFVSLIDHVGNLLETLSDSEMARLIQSLRIRGVNSVAGVNAFDVMERIYKGAKRQALGVDRAIDKLLSELDDSAPLL